MAIWTCNDSSYFGYSTDAFAGERLDIHWNKRTQWLGSEKFEIFRLFSLSFFFQNQSEYSILHLVKKFISFQNWWKPTISYTILKKPLMEIFFFCSANSGKLKYEFRRNSVSLKRCSGFLMSRKFVPRSSLSSRCFGHGISML